VDNIAIIIPSYEPSYKLISFTKNLLKNNSKIIVVDDGSGIEYQNIFNQLKKMNIVVLHHEKNLGKGKALKTAFNYCLNNDKNNLVGVVTTDDDGQHSVKDVLKIFQALKQNNNNLILGIRMFDKNVPFKSKFGNFITRYIFFFVTHRWLHDTQTGLRGIPFSHLKKLTAIPGNCYDYEMNVLLLAKKLNFKIKEITISTIYIDENKRSHFNPIKDSFKIYLTIISFIFKKS